MILLDLDDYADDQRSHEDIDRLIRLKFLIPSLKVTLFTIPGMCTEEFIRQRVEKINWIDLVQHGWNHKSNHECVSWTKADCKAALRAAREMGFTTKGFKAPGWQISDGCYEALAEEEYWLADNNHHSERSFFVDGLAVYSLMENGGALLKWLNKPSVDPRFVKEIVSRIGHPAHLSAINGTSIHGHIGHLGGHNANALELIMDDIRAAATKDSDFRFIKEVME